MCLFSSQSARNESFCVVSECLFVFLQHRKHSLPTSQQFSNTVTLCPLTARDQVSHPYEGTGIDYILYILIFNVLSKRREYESSELNSSKHSSYRVQLRWVAGLFTGHCHLKGHIFKLELTDDPTCEWCPEKDESATHILCDCEPIACLKFRHLGQYILRNQVTIMTPP
jgi:hypothetical protein